MSISLERLLGREVATWCESEEGSLTGSIYESGGAELLWSFPAVVLSGDFRLQLVEARRQHVADLFRRKWSSRLHRRLGGHGRQ